MQEAADDPRPRAYPLGTPPAWAFTWNPRDLLRRLWRHKGKMAAYFFGVMTLVTAVTFLMPPEYRSEAKLFVRIGRENVGLDPTTTLGQANGVLSIPNSREDEINSMIEMFSSRAVLERLVDEVGPAVILEQAPLREASRRVSAGGRGTVDPETQATSRPRPARRSTPLGPLLRKASYEPRGVRIQPALAFVRTEPVDSTPALPPSEVDARSTSSARWKAVERLQKRLSITAQRRSNVITLSLTAGSPRLAQALLTKLVDICLEEHVRLHRAPGSHEFLAAQAQALHARLREAEDRLRALKDATGLTSIQDQRRILVERIGTLEDELLESESQLAVAVAEIGTLRERLRTLPTMLETERATGFPNEATDGMRQQLYALQLKEQELLSKYKEDAPVVQEVRRQVRQALEILNREARDRTQVRSTRNPAHQQLELSYLAAQTTAASLRARRHAIQQQLDEARAGLATLNANEVEIADAQRQVELEEAKYRRYADTTEQARVDEALELRRISNLSLAQPATLEERPVKPRKRVNVALGLIAATIGALAIGLIAEYRAPAPRPTDSGPTGIPAGGRTRPSQALYPAAQFRAALDRQRARSDRTGEGFALLLFGWQDAEGRRRGLEPLCTILTVRLRTSDEVGWFDAERVGVVLHDATPTSARAVVDDISSRYPRDLPPLVAELFVYPSDGPSAKSSQTWSAGATRPAARTAAPSLAMAPVAAPSGAHRVRPMEPVFARPMPAWKRALDIVGAAIGLLLTSPFMLVAAIAIKIDSRGPVFFRQQRTGLGGVPFTMYKLRTMQLHAEKRRDELAARSERDGPFKMARDPRVTRFGRWLRQTSLDELPQLWNVLKGDMSLVGPRPLPCAEAQSCEPWQRQRVDVTPGLTCIWQVSGRAHIPFVQWVRMDVKYIRSRSLMHDLKLLLKTIPAVAFRRGAY